MTSKAYALTETPITFKDSGGTVVFTPTSLATVTGRQSAQHDFGAGTTARAFVFNWRAYVEFSTTPVVGETVDIYLKTSDGTFVDNDDGTSDAALSSVDKLNNLQYIGSIVVDEAATAIPMVAHGQVTLNNRYVQVVFYNRTVDTLSSTAADNGFILEPVVIQGQAT